MERRDFLRLLGISALLSQVALPSFAEVEQEIAKHDGIEVGDKDPFAVIRNLMKERALPDWEYYFLVHKTPTFSEGENSPKYRHEFAVFLFQNRNYHKETFCEFDIDCKFNERTQRLMFDRLMDGVDKFNALPEEKRNSIIQMMDNIKKYGHA